MHNVWVDNMNWKNSLGCTNFTCLQENLTWRTGQVLESGVFASIDLASEGECWFFETSGKRLRSSTCTQDQYVVCQLDCRPGMPITAYHNIYKIVYFT